MPFRRQSFPPTYTPYPRRSSRRRSYVEIDEDIMDFSGPRLSDNIEVAKRELFHYPVMRQAASINLVCFDRETGQFVEFPYPTDRHERKIEPSGFNAYFTQTRRLSFECFCGLLTSKPKFIKAKTVRQRTMLLCYACGFNIDLDVIYHIPINKKQFYLIPDDQDMATRPVTSSMILVRERAALPAPQHSGIPHTNFSSGTHSGASSPAAGPSTASDTSNITRWELCAYCDGAFLEGNLEAHQQNECAYVNAFS